MILLCTKIVKILLLFAVILCGYSKWHKSTSGKWLCCLGVLLILMAIVSNGIAGLVLPISEKVTLTALGEKNHESMATEVYINGFTIDGEEVEINQPVEGKWFWSGDNYAWRIETDLRQPKGTTRSIVLEVPVGWERSINFEANEWRGLVEIRVGEVAKIVDTYAPDTQIISEQIGSSSTKNLILNQLRYLIVYAVVLLSVFAIIYTAKSGFDRKHKCIYYLTQNYDICIYILLGIFMMIAMRFYHQFNDMFWGDDFINIDVVAQDSLKNALVFNWWFPDFTPPLFNFLVWFVAKLLPHSFNALLWIPQIFLSLSAVVMGLIGRSLFNKSSGIIAAVIVATSSSLILCTGYEFRGYSLYLLLAACTLLLYIGRLRLNRFVLKYLVLLALAYTAVLYAHYFGFMIIGIFFLADLWLVSKRRCDVRYIIPYFVSGGAFGMWVISVLLNKSTLAYASGQAPTLIDILNTIVFFFSDNKILMLIWISSAVWIIAHLKNNSAKTYPRIDYFIIPLCLLMVVTNITATFAFSQLKPIYKNRYLIGLMPFMIVILLFGMNKSISLLTDKQRDKLIIEKKCALVIFFIFMVFQTNNIILHDMGVQDSRIISEQSNTRMAYLDIISNLQSQSDILYQDTAVFVNQPQAYSYLLKNGKFNDVNIESSAAIDQIKLYNTIYYVYYDWASINYLERDDSIKNEFIEAEKDEGLGIVKYVRNVKSK